MHNPSSSSDRDDVFQYGLDDDAEDEMFLFLRDTSNACMHPAWAAADVETKKKLDDQSPKEKRDSGHPRRKDVWDFERELMAKAKHFRGVLMQPIPMWNDMEEAVLQYAPQWKPSQRSKLIELWVKFLELKILAEDCAANQKSILLTPTALVGRIWYAIVQNKHLYQEVTFWIQDFHKMDRRPIYRPPLTLFQPEGSDKPIDDDDGTGSDDCSDRAHFQVNSHEKLERTQRLFICYFQQAMPETLTAVNNMSKRRISNVVYDDNIVEENASICGISDFSQNDEEDFYHESVGSDSFAEFSATTVTWASRLLSLLSCWEDPYAREAQRTGKKVAAAVSSRQQVQNQKKKKKQALEQSPHHQDSLSFWPCAGINDQDIVAEDQCMTSNSSSLGNSKNESLKEDSHFTYPTVDETEEGSSHMWVTFDSSKNGLNDDDDDVTLLTMDTYLHPEMVSHDGASRQFYSPPRNRGPLKQSMGQSQAQRPKENGKAKNFRSEWKFLETKLRIASMIIKELE